MYRVPGRACISQLNTQIKALPDTSVKADKDKEGKADVKISGQFELINPEDIKDNFDSIIGLETAKDELRDQLIT